MSVLVDNRNAWEAAIRDAARRGHIGRSAFTYGLVMATFGDWDGTSIKVGLRTMCDTYRCSRGTAVELTETLIESGWIDKVMAGSGTRAAEYRLTTPSGTPCSTATGSSGTPSDTATRASVASGTQSLSSGTPEGASGTQSGLSGTPRSTEPYDLHNHKTFQAGRIWNNIIDPLPDRIRRRLDDEPDADKDTLTKAIAAAEQRGVKLRRQDVWDSPTSLDDQSIRSVSKPESTCATSTGR